MLSAEFWASSGGTFSGCCGDRNWEQFGKFAQVLDCGGEVELVFCAAGTSKTQAVELQDAFEVREQHLDPGLRRGRLFFLWRYETR